MRHADSPHPTNEIIMTHPKQNVRRQRRGVLLSLELVIALPILLVVILSAVEFTFLLLGSQAITAAANVGARQAALPSTSSLDVERAVYSALGSWRWAQTTNDLAVLVYVDQDDNGQIENDELVHRTNNLSDSNGQLANAPTGTVVQVTIQLPAIAAAPDLLGFVPGLSIKGQELTASFVTRKE